MKTPIDAMIDLLGKLAVSSSTYDSRPGILIKKSSDKIRSLLQKLSSDDLNKIRFEKGFVGWDKATIEKNYKQKLKFEFDNKIKEKSK